MAPVDVMRPSALTVAFAGACCMILALIVCFILLTIPATSGGYWAGREPLWVWVLLFFGALFLVVMCGLFLVGCGETRGDGGDDDVKTSWVFVAFFILSGLVCLGALIAFIYYAATGKVVPASARPAGSSDQPRDNLLLYGSAVAVFLLVCVPLVLILLCVCFGSDFEQRPWRLRSGRRSKGKGIDKPAQQGGGAFRQGGGGDDLASKDTAAIRAGHTRDRGGGSAEAASADAEAAAATSGDDTTSLLMEKGQEGGGRRRGPQQ